MLFRSLPRVPPQISEPSSQTLASGAGDGPRRVGVRRDLSRAASAGSCARAGGSRAGGDGGEADLGDPPAVQRPARGGEEEAEAGGGHQQRQEAAAPGDQLPPGTLLRHELRAGALPQHTAAGGV